MRTPKLLAVLATSALLAACKNDENAAVADAAPPPTVTVTVTVTVTAPPPTVPVPATPVPAVPGKPATTATANPGTPGAGADAGAPADAGAAGTATGNKLAGCFEKCQGIMQSCLTPTIPPDGGIPQLKDPAACQAAFSTCQTACTP